MTSAPASGAPRAHESPPLPLGPMRALNDLITRGEVALLVVILLGMVTLAFTQVLLRQIAQRWPVIQPVGWFGPLTQHLVVWVGLIGASIATREGRHFGVEALTNSFSTRGRRRLDIVLSTVAGAFTLALAVLSWNHLVLGEMKAVQPVFVIDTLLGIPVDLHVFRWQLLVVVPAELALMVYRFALRGLEAALLDDDTWRAHDHSLRPELEQPAAAPPAAAPARVEEKPADPPAPPPPAEPPPPAVAQEETRPRRSTEEVRTYRIADTGDVIEPEPQPGEPISEDDSNLVDSELDVDEEGEKNKDKPGGGA